MLKQECIPVGCLPPASVAVSGRGCLPGGVCPGGVCLPGGVYLSGTTVRVVKMRGFRCKEVLVTSIQRSCSRENFLNPEWHNETRKHSTRMRTARQLWPYLLLQPPEASTGEAGQAEVNKFEWTSLVVNGHKMSLAGEGLGSHVWCWESCTARSKTSWAMVTWDSFPFWKTDRHRQTWLKTLPSQNFNGRWENNGQEVIET